MSSMKQVARFPLIDQCRALGYAERILKVANAKSHDD